MIKAHRVIAFGALLVSVEVVATYAGFASRKATVQRLLQVTLQMF